MSMKTEDNSVLPLIDENKDPIFDNKGKVELLQNKFFGGSHLKADSFDKEFYDEINKEYIELNNKTLSRSENNSTIYPCGKCDKPVTWDDKGIVCDTCNQWYHAQCQSLDTKYYLEHVNNSGIAWDCIMCECPNYSTFCYSLVFSTSNQFSILSDTPLDSPTPTRNLRPVHSSTPDNTRKSKATSNTTSTIRMVNVNFQSSKTKQGQLYNMLDSTKRDIILGTETWIDSSIKDSQIFPPGYNIYRNDRNLNGGGVLVAVRDNLISSPVTELQTDCEMVWCKLELVGHKAIYLTSFYNPKTSNEEGYKQFDISMSRATNVKNAFIIAAGDFNLPGWDWKTNQLKPKTQNVNIHHKFTDILDDHGLTQIVNEPTRGTNTLDLFITNYPDSFRRTEVIPGLSDHDIVYTEVDRIPAKLQQKPRKIFLYKKARWQNVKDDLHNIKVTAKSLYDIKSSLHCCGVYYANDTRTTQGKQFCCRNAHPSITNSDDPNTLAYSELLESLFGGCGSYKTETCADAILVKTRMFVAWFLAIVLLQIVLEIIAVIFVNKEMMFRGIKSFCVSNWKRSKMTMVHLISLGSLFICNLVVLCLAINIRYDKVFGNSDIQELFSRISIANYYNFMKTINVFSIVNVTFSSVSIANVIFSIVLLVLPKWKRVLSFVSIGLLCIVAVGNFIQVGLFMKFFNNVSSGLDDRLMNQFNTSYRYNGGYDYSDYSATHESSSSLSWNTLFVQAECCGVGPRIESSFESTYWYIHGDRSVGEEIPVQCCISQSNVFPYNTSRDVRCNSPILEGYFHSQSCDVAVNIRLRIYSTVFIVFMAIIILAEICCVVTTLLNAKRFKQDATILNRSKKPSGEDTEMRKNDKTQKEKDNARKKRKHGDKEAKGLPRNKKQRSVGTVEIHQKANTIVQENAGENIELQMMKSMEIEDTVNNKPDKPNNKRRQDDLAEKDLTMLDN
ncbi:unnamed protein product [Mytilus coruscus]|uniref:PHD-type domain-containing protein n=1 Tax=Mytilus coruscus TaxID=42192 RepID=A0A6J8ERJ3_MYTCO|nr:unnamed protein product [Mytilus coruscus]